MDWEVNLISLYLYICKAYDEKLWLSSQRLSNGGYKRFTDEEVMTLYLFGHLVGHRTIKSIHHYGRAHLMNYFPHLPGYAAYVHRINRLAGAFNDLVSWQQATQIAEDDERIYLADSMPITVAKNNHAYTAKVAREFASKSYNATKKMYYYGLRAHVVARKNPHALPDIECVIIEGAARQDGPLFDEMLRPHLHNNLLIADQAYRRPDEKQIEIAQDLKVITAPQKAKGQKTLEPDEKAFAKIVSRIKQPIEALFAWINRVSGIQDASLVRSTAGLITHCFGKLAAALMRKANIGFDF